MVDSAGGDFVFAILQSNFICGAIREGGGGDGGGIGGGGRVIFVGEDVSSGASGSG